MKILSRHICISMLMPLLYLILAFSMLFIIADLMDNGIDFYRSNSSINTIITYYALKIPSYFQIIIPICLLLATLYSLNNLTRHGEIIAMRASGISMISIIKPYLIIGSICFLIISLIIEFLPKNNYTADKLKENHGYTNEKIKNKIDYVNLESKHYWYIEEFNTQKNTLKGITLRKRRNNDSDLYKIIAEKGYWFNQSWWFENGSIQEFDEENNVLGMPKKFQLKEMNKIPEKPVDFIMEKIPESLSPSELITYIRTNLNSSPQIKTEYLITLHQKLSAPFMCIIAILLGIPLGAHTGRKSAVFGILLSIALFFSYYGSWFFMEYISRLGLISPSLGIWATTIIFLLIGIYFTKKLT